ncbi:hypothetical protein [Streptomyces sp. NPDC101237]
MLDPTGSPLATADVTVTALDTHRVVARGTTDQSVSPRQVAG